MGGKKSEWNEWARLETPVARRVRSLNWRRGAAPFAIFGCDAGRNVAGELSATSTKRSPARWSLTLLHISIPIA